MNSLTNISYKPLVLVIDPDKSYQSVIQDLLGEHMKLKFADNYFTALELTTKYEFSMVISEVEFPDIKITDIIKKFKTINPNIYFVVITNKNDTQLAVEVMKSGAIDFIVKPFAVDDIANLIDKYLKLSVNKKFDYDLINIITEEKRTFILPTNIHILNPFLYEFIEMIKRFKGLTKNDIFSTRLAIYEMLVNAIEHGNLEIDYEKKKKLLSAGINYIEYLDNLGKSEPFNQRKIEVSYLYTGKQLQINIRDEGNGFDVNNFENRNIKNDLLALHGRGIIISKFNMDEISYNEKGNEVTLTKYLGK
jgi:FixJ family two-component response regulator